MVRRMLCILALFMGVPVFAQACETGHKRVKTEIVKISLARLSPIVNDTSGVVSYAYPYVMRIYYVTAFPDSILFAVDWGNGLTAAFPYDTLKSGSLSPNLFYQDFGIVYQHSGIEVPSILVLGAPGSDSKETQFVIRVPSKKALKNRRLFKPQMSDPPLKTSEDQF